METFKLVISLTIVWFVVSKLYAEFVKGGDTKRHCTRCGTDAPPRTVTRGSIFIEILLWLCFLVPGLIYSIWRLTTRHQACAACGSPELVPMGSPAAMGATGGHVLATPETHVKCPDCRELVLKDARKCKHCGTALVPQ